MSTTTFLRRSDSTWISSGVVGPGAGEAARVGTAAWRAGTLKVLHRNRDE